MQPVLAVSRLGLDRGSTRILRGIDWTVQPGQHWAILGANGSGKTSLLRALTGYFTPSRGSLTLLGQIYGESDWPALRRHVGLVTSAFVTAIPSGETAIETVISGRLGQIDLWARPTRADREQALRLLRSVGIARLAGQPWAQLSQGERQRVLIARALAARPAVLILDEPCAGLDPVARERFLAFLSGLVARRGRSPAPTVILVTHHVEEIFPGISHVLLLRRGRVLASGRRRAVLTDANLSAAFGTRVRLRPSGRRWRLDVQSAHP